MEIRIIFDDEVLRTLAVAKRMEAEARVHEASAVLAKEENAQKRFEMEFSQKHPTA